ncbi:MAG: hypothetical protein FWH02_00815 [Oscillospiraceae bacterium]|nr:hypothetical protein [Oscillospiraceae bacterium]
MDHNPDKENYDDVKLSECDDVNDVPNILTTLGVPDDTRSRINFLYKFMGVESVFTCGPFTVDEEYETAIYELVYNYNKSIRMVKS